MSIEIVLLPLAIAAVSAWQAKRDADEAGRQVVSVGTRMRNEEILQAAIADSGATVTRDESGIVADWGSSQARFTRNVDGIWAVHLAGDTDLDEATALVRTIDAAYGRRVQQEVLSRLRQRAPEVGMTVESETVEDDESVTLTLNVNAAG